MAPDPYGNPGMAAGGSTLVQSPQGMQFSGQARGLVREVPPSAGKRVLRGWLWGGIYGQWWTLWTVISSFIWGAHSGIGFLGAIIYLVIYGFFGSLAGLIIGASDADRNVSAGIAIGAGVIVCLIEAAFGGASAMINLIFYFFTGRFIGPAIRNRVQQPILVGPQ